MSQRAAFLLGAGVSIPAGFPSTSDITKQVLSGEGVMRHSNRNYLFGEPMYGRPDKYVPKVTIFLNRLKIEIDLYYLYQSERFTNYEDLYYVASQIEDSEHFEYDNPVVRPFIRKILSEVRALLVHKGSAYEDKLDLGELATETTRYIHNIVWQMLSKNPDRVDHLRCIKDTCLSNTYSGVDIFTLNHDTTLEQYFSQNDIQVVDGFDRDQNSIRYWNPEIFDQFSKVRLFKLHGSVNWFRFRPDGGDWSNESIGIPRDWDIWHIKDQHGKHQLPVDGKPEFLAGTFNKMLNYTGGIYSELHCQFHTSIKKANTLITSGYSFRDKGINNRIIDWVFSAPGNRIILIHPDPAKLRQKARGSISNKWDKWTKDKTLITIEKAIEDTEWQDILDCV